MANYSSLLAAVNAAITANGTGAITGPVLNTVLQQMIVSLGQGGYIFKGRAIPTTDPGSPDQNVFYIATTPGTYTNFSSIVVAAGECAILKGSGTSWSKEATGIDLVSVSQNSQTGKTELLIGDTPALIVDNEPEAGSDNLVKSGGVYKSLSSKIETNSVNIIDYSKCSLNKGLGVFGEVVDNVTGYSISDYIPVKQGDEIIANVWDISSSSWSPYAVYDINLNHIRSIRNNSEPSHYVYQEGDAYIRCMFDKTNIQDIYGNYGGTLLPYQEYNPIKGYFDTANQKDKDDIAGLQDEVDVVDSSVESMVQLHPYNYVINQDGDIVLQANEICPIYKLRVTPFTKYKLDDVRAIVVATGSYYKYAWYSSYEVIGSTTFISGELGAAPFDEHIIKTIIPPAGAMALVVMAYYGTENVKKEQNSANSMLELYFKRNIIEKSFNIPFKQVINGKQKIYGTAFSLNNYGVNPVVNGVSPYENTLSLSGLGWCYFGPFNPDNDEIIHISFNVSQLVKAEGSDISIWVSKTIGSAGSNQQLLGVIDHIGDYHIYLDPTYYRIYHGYSDTFYIWVYKIDYDIETCVIENFQVYAMMDSEEFNNIEGVTSEELFKSTDEGIGLLNKAIDKKEYLVAPNGNKYDYGVDNNGNIIAIPVIPNKVAFFGNSLMFGNVYFGMDASNIDNDFYAKVNAYIATLNPNYVANRHSSVPFETIGSLDNIDSVVAATVANLQGDEDLVVIQAGDNTTDEQATTIMPTSCMRLLAAIRTKCPNARICWPAIWYATTTKMNNVRNACDRYGAIVATIGELNIPENRGTVGSIIDYGQGNSVQNTLNDVSNLVENTPNNITVTFTYSGGTYTQTIDVDSYSLDGSTLTYTGRYRISTVGAGHPGNRGMKAIANKILYAMGISDNENAYPLD